LEEERNETKKIVERTISHVERDFTAVEVEGRGPYMYRPTGPPKLVFAPLERKRMDAAKSKKTNPRNGTGERDAI
jgi:hypothetical protein